MKNPNMNVVLYETGTRQCLLAASNISLFRLTSLPSTAEKREEVVMMKSMVALIMIAPGMSKTVLPPRL